MKHEELIKTIDSWQHSDSCALLMDGYCDCPFKALRAVVELHRPDKRPTWLPIQFQGYGCFNCGGNYPCATIKSIEKELS